MLSLQIETTSTCQAKCVFCPYPKMGRAGGLMGRGLFEKIIDEATSIQLISGYVLNGLGEPTLDPHLVERVAYIKKRAPGHEVAIYSNGIAMRDSLFERLAEAGLDTIVFSLNAANAAHHEAIMNVHGKYESTCANIDYAIAHKRGMHIEVRAVIAMPHWRTTDAEAFFARWGDGKRGGHGLLVHEGNWSGDNRTALMFRPNECCHRAVRQIYVMYDGRVSTCCFDPSGKQVFGNLTTQTIREVYASDQYVAFRKAHVEDRADAYQICKVCTRI